MVVGTWTFKGRAAGIVSARGEFTFSPDKTFQSWAVIRFLVVPIRVHVDGKWQIENGVLIEEVTKSSHPSMASPGLVTRDSIVRVNAAELVTQPEAGSEEHYRRKAQETPRVDGSRRRTSV